MNRYNMVIGVIPDTSRQFVQEVVCGNGKWSLHDDLQREVDKRTELYKKRIRKLEEEINYRQLVASIPFVSKCNCEKEYNKRVSFIEIRDVWFCPVHGYKKL